MSRSLERSGSTPIRVLVVGSPEWRRAASAGLEDDSDHDLTITASVASHADLEEPTLDASDCVLTDDQATLSSIDADAACPVVYTVDPTSQDDIDVGRLLAAGADEVLATSTVAVPSLLERRLRQVLGEQRSTARETVDRPSEWYRRVMAHSSDLQLVFDESGRVTFVSRSADEIVDSNGDAMTTLEEFARGIRSDDRDALRDAFDAVQAAEPGTTETVEYRYQRGTDDNDSWHVHETRLTNRLEDVDGIVASIRDTTEFHSVERELDESFDRITDGFFALGTAWQFTYVNDRAVELIGLDQSEVLGRPILEVFPEMVGTAFQREAIEAMGHQEPRTIERYYEPYESWVEARLYPSPSGLSVYFRDVTARVERERQLQERTEWLQAVVENAPVMLYALESDGEITLAEGRAFDDLESLSSDVVGRSIFDVFDEQSAIRADMETLLDGTPTHSTVRTDDRAFEMWGRPILEGGTVERAIGIAVDVTERVQYRETLNAIHEATRRLLTADSRADACEYIVEIAADVLDLETVFYRFDERDNELVPAAFSAVLESTIGSPPRIRPTDGIAWQTFVSETTSVFDDVGDSDRLHEDMTNARSALYVPLGEHGVLVALSAEPGQYGDDTVELTRLFTMTAETALDRLGRAHQLRERERELQQQNEHLERLNAANRVRQDLEQQLLLSDSRDEIERGICDRLAELESCSMAWIGDPDPGGNQLQPRTVAGRERGYLEGVTATTVDDSAAEPAGRAARTGEPVSVENVAEAVHDGAWRADALSANFQSAYAVPLVYDDFLYGVLTLYGDDRDAFDDHIRSTLAELGESIAYTIDAVNRKNALLGSGVTEVELEIESDFVLSRLADHLGTRIELEGATARADSTVVFLAVDDTLDDDSMSRALEVDGIGAASIITDGDTDRHTVIQVELTGPYLGAVVGSYGGSIRELVANDETRAVITVPDAVEVREVLAEIERRGISTSMVARREEATDTISTPATPVRDSLLEAVTDRQREVVQTAYHGGFFDWPRQSTGEEIAASLEISSPAFHKHIRAAERKLFRQLFDDGVAES